MSYFNFYSFILNGEEKIYYTSVINGTKEEILEWATRFGFIGEEDIPNCINVRSLSFAEVELRNSILYKEFLEERSRLIEKGVDIFELPMIPPLIGDAQLD